MTNNAKGSANPFAGRGRVRDFLRGFLPDVESSGRDLLFLKSERPWHATDLAREAARQAGVFNVSIAAQEP